MAIEFVETAHIASHIIRKSKDLPIHSLMSVFYIAWVFCSVNKYVDRV